MNTGLNPGTTLTSHRFLIMAAMLATYMQAMNISIPNAAVLYLEGALSMTDDELGWVFTSYIAASAVVLPITHWLAGKYGRKAVFQISITLFSVGLILDTLATTPLQFAAARIFQGAASGTLAPLSISILLDELPPLRHGHIGILWSVTALLGMLSGPGIGGWLSEYAGWRSIFYLSLPLAAFIALTMGLYLKEKKAEKSPPFDFFGMAVFSMGVIGLQMLLDRGERMEWFASPEIWAEAIASVLGFYLYIVHVLTKDEHFLHKDLFKDRNFGVSTVIFFALGFVLLPTLALTSPMLEELLGYPAHTAGDITIPRGVALVGTLLLTWSPPARIDNRLFVIVGLGLGIYGNWQMLGYSPLMDGWPVVLAGATQGAGLGMLMPALTRSAFSTLNPKFRSEGTMFFNLSRLYGSTIGIAIVQIFLFNNTQAMHLALAKNLRPYRIGSDEASSMSMQGLAMMNDLVTGQAAIIAIIDQFKILLVALLIVSPLALLLRKPRPAN